MKPPDQLRLDGLPLEQEQDSEQDDAETGAEEGGQADVHLAACNQDERCLLYTSNNSLP